MIYWSDRSTCRQGNPTAVFGRHTAVHWMWHTELEVMKTVVAGAVGASCIEANLTLCGQRLDWGVGLGEYLNVASSVP